MSDFNTRAEAAQREGRLDGLRQACVVSVLEYHPRIAKAVLPAIMAEKREERLIRWTVEAGRMRGPRFSLLFRADRPAAQRRR